MTLPDRARSWAFAALAAAVVALSVAVAGHLFLEAGLRQSRPSLEEAARTGAIAVGEAVAGQFAYALELGIPLDKMPGVDAYLERVVANSPQVEGIALIDGTGRTLAQTHEHVEGNRFPIAGGGQEATLVVAPESPFLDQAVRQMRLALAITALFSGMLTGGIVLYFFAFRYEPARQQLLDDLDRVASGDFDIRLPAEDRGPLGEAARVLSACIERVRAARRTLLEAVATIRAIDFDGSLGQRVDAILQPIDARYHFPEGDEAAEITVSSGSGWRAAIVLGLYFAAFPYLANFAIDREPDWLPAAWIPVLPMLIELVAALAGAALASSRMGRSGTALGVAGLGLAACLAGTYWCREYEPFLLLRAGSGFLGGFLLAGLLVHRPTELRRGDLAPMLAFAALLAGPLLASLYAEAIGRRSGFMVIGLALLVATPFVATGTEPMLKRARLGLRNLPFDRSDLLLAVAILPASAMMLVNLPGWISYDRYLLTGCAMAVMALCALAVPALPAPASAVALLAAGLVFLGGPSQPILALLACCALLGAAGGGAMKSFDGNRPWLALAGGTAVALLATGLAAQADVGFAAVPVGAAILLTGCWLLTRRPAQAMTA